MSLDHAKIEELFLWMCDGARPSADARQIVAGICERARMAGIAVDRFALFIYTLHPNLLGRRFIWSPETEVQQHDAHMTAFQEEEYLAIPLPTVLETQKSLRRRLTDPDCPNDFKILKEIQAQGATDYLVQPLIFTTGETHAVSWTSNAPDGFTDDMIAALERLRLPLARLAETYMLRLNASTLLSAYIGRNSGGKILAGQVHRGDFEVIHACVVFADLVGFTKMSNELHAEAVIERLNRFYDHVVPPIIDRGGEILKFMGDGLLAIFPVSDRCSEKEACRQAAEALSEASGGDGVSYDAEAPPFRASIHVGPIHYGNIGSVNRLDFTAIGSAVNLASRLLSKAESVGAQTVISEPVADMLDIAHARAPHIHLKGFTKAQKIVVLRDMPESS
ncbi:MAG: adenylate/guanylate cyclase domain-containing protein [Stappiaceae bacterium]